MYARIQISQNLEILMARNAYAFRATKNTKTNSFHKQDRHISMSVCPTNMSDSSDILCS